MKFWRVTFKEDGAVESVAEVTGPEHGRWLVVEAADEAAARKIAYNMYCARKKKEAKERLNQAGKCCCGRTQDRKHPNGMPMKTCSTCAERQAPMKADWYKRREEAQKTGKPFVKKVRDEADRVAKCSERVRDRKSEMRLEVLCEVKKAWYAARTMSLFGQWLEGEVKKLTD